MPNRGEKCCRSDAAVGSPVLATASTVSRGPATIFAGAANVGRFGGRDVTLNAQQSVEVAACCRALLWSGA